MKLDLMALSKSPLGKTSGRNIVLSLSLVHLMASDGILYGHILAFNGVNHEAVGLVHGVMTLRISVGYFCLIGLRY